MKKNEKRRKTSKYKREEIKEEKENKRTTDKPLYLVEFLV